MRHLAILAVLLLLAVGAANAQLLTDFEAYNEAAIVLFQYPGYSGSTTGSVTSVNGGSDNGISTAMAASGTKSEKLTWSWNYAETQGWVRVTTYNAPSLPNAAIPIDKVMKVKFYLGANNPTLGWCVGVRETNTTQPLGGNGGGSGSIEWVGANGLNAAAATGTSAKAPLAINTITPMDAWQTLSIDFTTAPVTGFTGNGVLTSTTGMAALESFAFTNLDGSTAPITLYIDDISFEPVPEPGSILALCTGLVGLIGIRRRMA